MSKIRLPKINLGKIRQKVIVQVSSYSLKIAFFEGAKLKWWKDSPLEKTNDREISEMLKEAFRKKNVKPKTGIFVLSRDLLKVGVLHLPSVNEEELASMVRVNALRQVPYPKDEIVLGWRVSATVDGYSDVFLAICQKDLIRRYIAILETAGLDVKDIYMVSEGSLSWLLNREKSNLGAEKNFILDIHRYNSDLIVFKDSSLMNSCLISQGADFLEKGPDNIKHFLNEFKQTIEMLPAALLEKRADSLFLIGAKHKFVQLEESLKKEFGFRVLRRQTEEDFGPNVSFAGLVGIGQNPLAKRVAFDIADIKMKKLWQKKIKQLILFGAALTYSIIIVLVILGFKIYRAEKEVSTLESSYSQHAKEAERLSGLLDKIKVIQDIKLPEESLTYYFSVVSQSLPAGSHLVDFSFQKQSKLVIKGQAQAISLVFDFVSSLEQTEVFREVKTTYTRRSRRNEEGKGSSEFEIVCFLK